VAAAPPRTPRGAETWCSHDRTAGVHREHGYGKTLDLPAPAPHDDRGTAMATLTKVDDLLLTAGP